MVVEEVNATIATGYYEDETILLKDLLDPENSPVYQQKSFKDRQTARGFKVGLFKESFEKVLGISSSVVTRTSDLYFVDNGISIYFPYHEDTQYSTYPVTLVPATVESDRATVQHPLCDDLNAITLAYCSQTVMVNDDYASSSPTHIVGMGATLSNSTASQSCQGPVKVFIGYVKISGHQYDKLISLNNNGGGSELRFVTAKSLQHNTTVTAFSKEQPQYVTRKEIKNGTWVAVWKELDGYWQTSSPDQFFGIYEHDVNKGTKYFTGQLTYADYYGTSTQSLFSIAASTGDNIVSNRIFTRYNFNYLANTYGQSPEYQTGYGPQYTSSDTFVTFSLPITCY
jgi:hypothetical protein